MITAMFHAFGLEIICLYALIAGSRLMRKALMNFIKPNTKAVRNARSRLGDFRLRNSLHCGLCAGAVISWRLR